MPGAIATIGSMHVCPMCSGTTPHIGGPVAQSGVPGATINGKSIAVMGDLCTCIGPPDVIAQGEAGVTINGMAIATVGCLTAHGGTITMGEVGATITPNSPTPLKTMARHKIPFPKITLTNKILGNAKQAKTNQQSLANQAPVEDDVKDSTTVSLKNSFASNQFQNITACTDLASFMALHVSIFGEDIPKKAFKELYNDVLNKAAILEPKIQVKKTLPNGGKAAFYDDKKSIHEIWVAEQVIRDAALEENNELRGELMTALIEEYGHYLDYLLRHHYAVTENKDAMRDEGARYAYRMYQIDPIEQANQHFADAVIDGNEKTLVWDFKTFNNNLKKYVNQQRQNQDDNYGNLEFYKAGYIKTHGQYGHGDVEEKALRELFISIYLKDENNIQKVLDTIYLGNWLRDFSQAVDPMMVNPLSKGINTINATINTGLKPISLSVDILTTIVRLAAAKEFIHKKEINKDEIVNYNGHLITLKEEFIDITPETLGPYRPEEHIDNPKGLGHDKNNKNRGDKTLYNKFVGYVDNANELHTIDKVYGMKKYIRKNSKDSLKVEKEKFNTTLEYIQSKLEAASKFNGLTIGNKDSAKSLIDFGAAMHTLEDYFAHTNFTEIALMKHVQPLVFPWVDSVPETGFVYNYDNFRNDKGYDKKYTIFNTPVESSVHRLATYIPIVTGTFGIVDTAASVLPILNEHFFSVEFEDWEKFKPRERTFADVLIIEIAKNYDDANNKSGISSYSYWVEKSLQVRDYSGTYMDYIIPDFIETGIHNALEYLKQFLNFAKYFTIKAIANTLNDAQVLLDKDLKAMEVGKFNIGIDPSHTQIAKDDTKHPLHELSALLAVDAVKTVGKQMVKVWQNGGNNIESVHKLIDSIIMHPAKTTWQDKIVTDWAKNNQEKICKACSPSMLIDRTLHAIEEIDEGLESLKTYLNNSNLIENVVGFIEQQTGEEIDEQKIKNTINSAINKSQEQRKRIEKLETDWKTKYPKPIDCLKNLKKYYHYNIKAGDTLSDIAIRANTTVSILKEINNLSNDEIKAGKMLKSPNPVASKSKNIEFPNNIINLNNLKL